MQNQQTLQHLRSLKLTGMANALEQQQAQPSTHNELCFEERLSLLVDRETTHRQNNKITRLLKAAKLKTQASPEDVDYMLATQACRLGFSVRYFRSSRLLEELSIAHGDGRYSKLINQLAKIDLLILDDWGLETLSLGQRNDLLEIMEDRHGAKSTLVTSQLPINKWHQAIGDATLADAILDRLVHNGHKLNLRGDSMRKKQSAFLGDPSLEEC